LAGLAAVATPIAIQFFAPPRSVAFRAAKTSRAAMPEATVHEDRNVVVK
jgi:hypothetical protein